jgi:flagellar biosynthesis/type III secretory pathway M-ring protein FliF/YscJ
MDNEMNQTVNSADNQGGPNKVLSLVVGVILLAIIVLAVLAWVGRDQVEAPADITDGMTEEELIDEALRQMAEETEPLTEEEREEINEALRQMAEESEPLTEEEQRVIDDILRQMAQ